MSTINQSSYSPQLRKRIFLSGAVGNIIETYDLILVSLMATTLSKVFFPPSANPNAHVIDVLYVFLIGLLVRPIGNIIMGLFADQIGRKRLMVISILFTGIGTACIGLLPNYYYFGIWSTVLFITLRITQNFFAGIEYINSATYLIESSDSKTRGYFGSWTAIGISGGYLLASIVALTISQLIANELIPSWSWRFVFLFSIGGMIFGLWIRFSIPESLIFIMNNLGTQPTKKSFILKNSIVFIKKYPVKCLSIGAITLMGTCLSYIYYVYIPINLVTNRGFSQTEAISINVISLSIVVILIPIFGKLSDYFNKIVLLKTICFCILILAIPFFWLTLHGTYIEILLISILIAIPSSCFFGLFPVIVTEHFPANIRCTTASLIYQIVFSLVMGTLPILVNYLTNVTKLPLSPGFILICSSLIGFIGLHFLLLDKKPYYSTEFVIE